MVPALLLASLSVACAHVCLINPAQRGGFNVSDPGDYSCFQPTAPCGSVTSALPAVQLVGGEVYNVYFQQNLNHYNPGFPGFLDVAWAPFPDPPSDDNFTVIATIPDFWAHLQAAQTNFSLPALIPNIDCAHCVLRVRYHPNKPTEPVFHQCADVSIVASPAPPPAAGRDFAFQTLGTVEPLRSAFGSLVEVLPAGALAAVPGSEGLAAAGVAIEGMVAVAGADTVYALLRTDAEQAQGAPASTISGLRVTDGALVVPLNISVPAGDPLPPTQWTALVAAPPTTSGWQGPPLLLLGLRAEGGGGSFSYQLRTLDPATGAASAVLAATAPTDTFVNFMFAANAVGVSARKALVYFLGGDENNLVQLDARVYTAAVDLDAVAPASIGSVQQDVSAFTLSALHAHPVTGALYAVSPGLSGQTAYALVQVDPASGAVSRVGAGIVPAGIFQWWYGGSVYGNTIAADGTLRHVFRRAADGTLVWAKIDLATGALHDAPTLMNGPNAAVAVHTAVHV